MKSVPSSKIVDWVGRKLCSCGAAWVFAENQLFGRLGRQSMHVLVEYAYLGGGDFDHRRIGLALNTLKDIVQYGADRELSIVFCMTFVIFTDASYEQGKSWLGGGILVGSSGRLMEYFSYFLQPWEMERLGSQEQDTIIHECEMISVVAALNTWEKKLVGLQVVFCLDF